MKISKNTQNHCGDSAAIENQVEPFIAELEATGYCRCSLCNKRVALRRFLLWHRHLRPSGKVPDESEVARFLARHCTKRTSLASRALYGFLEHLRRHGVIASTVPQALAKIGSTLEKRYADFLRNDKGLAESSLLVYLPVVAELSAYVQRHGGGSSLRRIDAGMLRAFLLEKSQGRSSAYVRLLAISLRSFLRFLHGQGEILLDLSAAVPSVRQWTQPDVPKKLTTAEVERVLSAPDRTTATGRRDLAILILLAELGLRAGEVIALELGDIRWRTGEILIRGKGGRRDFLPLPQNVGETLSCYIRLDRGHQPTQRVFLRAIAPQVPLAGPASIDHIVRRAMAQASVVRPKHIAAHLFRHTLASRMLQQGACLRDISEVLRHRALGTTEIYAKIDMNSLNDVVRPWPTRGGVK